MIIALALIVGFLKARFILSKTANRVIGNIVKSPEPAHFSVAFTKGYLILIGCMAALGMAINLLGMPLDFRGFIDAAIGSALINGSVFYIRSFLAVRSKTPNYLL